MQLQCRKSEICFKNIGYAYDYLVIEGILSACKHLEFQSAKNASWKCVLRNGWLFSNLVKRKRKAAENET
jgi:hypothetical protein